MSQVDLRQLAVDRSGHARAHTGRRVLSRYLLPIAMLIGFLLLIGWSSRDYLFPPRRVSVMPVVASQSMAHREGTPLFKAAGWIEPRPTAVRVAALSPGVVESLLVVEDEPVTAGQPVARLIPAEANLSLASAKANLSLKGAAVEQANAELQAAVTKLEQPVHLQAELGESEAALAKIKTQLTNLPFQIRRAAAEFDFAKQDYEGKLSAKGVVSGRALDQARSAMKVAEALHEELRGRGDSLEAEQRALRGKTDALRKRLELLADEIQAKRSAEAGVKAAQALLEQARVAVAEAQLRVDRMTVRAPIAGRVFELIAPPGARIGGGMTHREGHDGSTVVTLYRPDMLQVRVDTRFADIPKVRLGQLVKIESPAVAEPLMGTVLFVSSLADIQKNTLQVKVAIDSPPPVFKPEMLVDVTFLAPKPQDAAETTRVTRLYVPQTFVEQDGGQSFIWVADRSAGVARRTPVTTGVAGGNGLVEITSGLTLASRIIVAGTEGLGDGDRISVSSDAVAQPTGGFASPSESGRESTQPNK